MGVTRKVLSFTTLGLIDWRSDKERIARSTRLTKRAVKKQNRILRRQPAAPSMLPPPGWYPDVAMPSLLRWWDGRQWTAHTRRP